MLVNSVTPAIAAAGMTTVIVAGAIDISIGSILAGDREFIREARRLRILFGGAWRQAGIMAAAGLLVLAGAIAAGLRARLYESTVMKVVGATRLQIALAYGFEYALLGALCGLLALGAGVAAATLITRRVFEVAPVLDWSVVLITVAGGAFLTLAFGLGVTWTALSAKPAAQLRNL